MSDELKVGDLVAQRREHLTKYGNLRVGEVLEISDNSFTNETAPWVLVKWAMSKGDQRRSQWVETFKVRKLRPLEALAAQMVE
jgi:hypothetical protein